MKRKAASDLMLEMIGKAVPGFTGTDKVQSAFVIFRSSLQAGGVVAGSEKDSIVTLAVTIAGNPAIKRIVEEALEFSKTLDGDNIKNASLLKYDGSQIDSTVRK